MLDRLRQDIEKRLSEYQDPYLQQDLVKSKVLKNILIDQNTVVIDLVFGYPLATIETQVIQSIREFLKPVINQQELKINLSWRISPHAGQKGIKGLPQIKNIIAIASGKGGVGKSTTAVNVALALAKEGACVGILDADIYGPSQPSMLGINKRPETKDEKTILPILQHGIQSMSIGYLIDANSAMIWRGPMVSTALQQLLNDTSWDNLDYLVIDLPPGTGDIQLTLAQKIPVSGAVIITTPQDLALLDATRAIEMFKKVQVPVLGIVENMGTHICSNCRFEERIFSAGGGEQLAQKYEMSLLGSLPLDIRIREQTDSGTPPVIAEPTGQHALTYGTIARRIAAKLSLQAIDYSSKFPPITVRSD